MFTKLTIPKTISVGFQKRPGTYTGKLAYVIYTDAKGVLRKEKSWNGWRDKAIKAQEFDNVPTSGFVLNKKVGETRTGWNPRKAWFRVYDPRDFEFEISGANLLFILEECTSTKGKGLEGEFVYSWDGTELVLLPVSSQEYKNSAEFTDLQTKKLTKADIKEGCIYLNKDRKQVMYLGRHSWFQLKEDWDNNGHSKFLEESKRHIFVYVTPPDKAPVVQLTQEQEDELDEDAYEEYMEALEEQQLEGDARYWTQSGFTKLAKKLTDEPSAEFATLFEEFKKSVHGSKPVDVIATPANPPRKDTWSETSFTKKGKEYYPIQFSSNHRGGFSIGRSSSPVVISKENKVVVPSVDGWREKEVSHEELIAMGLYELHIKTESGALLKI